MSKVHIKAPAKPSKPRPDFPLFAHATGRWAKKIKGKLVYFGSWDDPNGALQRYEAHRDGAPIAKKPVTRSKRPKPRPDFPLFAHRNGQWCKKINGRNHYFGPWADIRGALKLYDEQKDALQSGRKVRPNGETVTVGDAGNAFLNAKEAKLHSKQNELSPLTFGKYLKACKALVEHFGKDRRVLDLDPQDFAQLRATLAAKWGVYRLKDTIQHMRSVFKHAFENKLIPVPVDFGSDFKGPSRKSVRLHKAEQGPRVFEAAEIRKLLDVAGVQLKAMTLLGINCAFGNSDCGRIPQSKIDLEAGYHTFARPKTGAPRRCPLWPETVEALSAAHVARPSPKSEEYANHFFLTRYGVPWAKDIEDSPITKAFKKLLTKVGISDHRGFYALRHTFRTIADGTRDEPACNLIMGHDDPSDMPSNYLHGVDDSRLLRVTDHIRSWLFGVAPHPLRKPKRVR